MSTVTNKSISQELNATLPTFEELTKTLVGHKLADRIVTPFIWSCDYDDRKIISIAMNNMCMRMQGIPFSENNGNGEYLCKDHMGRQYPFSGDDYDCLLKIMFCSWLQIGIIDEKNQDLYWDFKGQPGVFQVLD